MELGTSVLHYYILMYAKFIGEKWRNKIFLNALCYYPFILVSELLGVPFCFYGNTIHRPWKREVTICCKILYFFLYRYHYSISWLMNFAFLIFRAAEQLVGIELDPAKFTPSNTRFQRGSSSIRRRFRTNEITSTPAYGMSYVSTPVMEEDEVVDGDFYLLAKSYFDCREYRRAAHVLHDQNGKKSMFLRCYALYLVCNIFTRFILC